MELRGAAGRQERGSASGRRISPLPTNWHADGEGRRPSAAGHGQHDRQQQQDGGAPVAAAAADGGLGLQHKADRNGGMVPAPQQPPSPGKGIFGKVSERARLPQAAGLAAELTASLVTHCVYCTTTLH